MNNNQVEQIGKMIVITVVMLCIILVCVFVGIHCVQNIK